MYVRGFELLNSLDLIFDRYMSFIVQSVLSQSAHSQFLQHNLIIQVIVYAKSVMFSLVTVSS